MYLEAFLQQRPHFSPFFASLDGLLGVEATATLKRLASSLATMWKQSYSKMCGYVKSRITITLVRATHRCIRGSWVPAHRVSVQRPQWEDVEGLNLFRYVHQVSHNHPIPHDTPIPRYTLPPPRTTKGRWGRRQKKWRREGNKGGKVYNYPPLRKRHNKNLYKQSKLFYYKNSN